MRASPEASPSPRQNAGPEAKGAIGEDGVVATGQQGQVQPYHTRRIKTEEKAKDVASIWRRRF